MPAGSGNSKSSPQTREAKTKILVWFALIVAGIAIAATQWDRLFPLEGHEECAESAAKQTESKEASSIPITSCNSTNGKRREPAAGYVYYDSRQLRSFDIAGPELSAQELQYIEKQYSIYLEEKRKAALAQLGIEKRLQESKTELERRRQEAEPELEIRR